MEIWKEIPYYTKYEVSNKGRVRNKKTMRILSTKPTKSHRHPQVFLALDSKFWAVKHQVTLSHLVYETFLRKKGESSCMNCYVCKVSGNRIGHKDGDILNNSADNLFRY